MEEQLAMVAQEELGSQGAEVAAEAGKEVAEAAEEATGLTAIIEEINKYTDTHMMISMWAWEPEDVIAGESAGVCVRPTNQSDVNSSCWLWTMDEEGVYESANTSYLLDPYVIFQEGTRLEE